MKLNDLDPYELSEAENSNLRKHLLWCAGFLNQQARQELAARLKGTIENGGVVGDLEGDNRAYDLERDVAIVKLTDHIQEGVDKINFVSPIGDDWIAKADQLANVLRGYLTPATKLTFHELFNPEQPPNYKVFGNNEDVAAFVKLARGKEQ